MLLWSCGQGFLIWSFLEWGDWHKQDSDLKVTMGSPLFWTLNIRMNPAWHVLYPLSVILKLQPPSTFCLIQWNSVCKALWGGEPLNPRVCALQGLLNDTHYHLLRNDGAPLINHSGSFTGTGEEREKELRLPKGLWGRILLLRFGKPTQNCWASSFIAYIICSHYL